MKLTIFIIKDIDCDFILGFIHSIINSDKLIQTSLNQSTLMDSIDDPILDIDVDNESDTEEEDQDIEQSPDDTIADDENIPESEKDDVDLDEQEPDDDTSVDFNEVDDNEAIQNEKKVESDNKTVHHQKKRKLKVFPFVFSIVFLSVVGLFFFQQYQSSLQVKSVDNLVVSEKSIAIPVNIFKISINPFIDTLFNRWNNYRIFRSRFNFPDRREIRKTLF